MEHTDHSELGWRGLDGTRGAAGFAVVLPCLLRFQVSQNEVLLILVHLPVQQSPIVVPWKSSYKDEQLKRRQIFSAKKQTKLELQVTD